MPSKETPDGPGKVTVPMMRVLDVLLSEPNRDDWFALQICRSTRLGSGTVVQIMFRLDRWGWVESRWEDFDAARDQRRPRRKFYRLTGMGASRADAYIHEALPRTLRLRPA